MIDNPGKRIAAGFLKLLAGLAIALLILAQLLDSTAETDATGSHIETGQQRQ